MRGFLRRMSLIGAVVSAGMCGAQTLPSLPQMPSTGKNDVSGVSPASANYLFRASSPQIRLPQTSEQAVDERSYVLGGGDQLQIAIVNLPSMVYLGTVDQNGDLYLPTLGVVRLGMVTLAEAKELITDFVHAKLKKPEPLAISLRTVKSATVTVSGAVKKPGSYELAGTLRLWDAIRAANEERESAAKPEDTLKSFLTRHDLRMVRCVRRDTVAWYDLLAFLSAGDLSQNPYVYPADAITVYPVTRYAFVGGAVRGSLKGTVPIRPDEPVSSLLSLVVLDGNADSSRIMIRRADESRTITVDLRQKQETFLRNGDCITIPYTTTIPEIFAVTVSGEVERPGMYPIDKGATTAGEVLALAGDLTSFANTGKAVIIRRGKIPEPYERQENERLIETTDPATLVRPELSAAMGMMSSSKDFAVIRLSENPDVALEPKDEIFVPRAEKTVFVSGHVKRPGGYTFETGASKRHYVRLAGGYTDKADRSNVYIIAFFKDAFQTINRKTAEDGDIIVVPMSQQYKFFSSVFLPVLGVTLTAVTVLLGLVNTF